MALLLENPNHPGALSSWTPLSIHFWGSHLALTTRETSKIGDRIVGTGWDLLLLQTNPGSVGMEEGGGMEHG